MDLETIYMPNSVKTIGLGAFDDCPKLTKIVFNGTLEEWKAIEREGDILEFISLPYGTKIGLKNDVTPEIEVVCTDGVTYIK